ncbi:fatty acid desaturase [Nocardioides sp.]|uniref:fatty acid desaturase n=1 Tax=Nocardioides sp. TaxID=35761 RepID=UPI0035151595
MSTTTRPADLRPVLGLPDPGERVPDLAVPTAALYLGTLALFGVQVTGLVAGWTPWLLVPLGGVVTYLMFTVLHESIHHAISTRTRFNDLLGRISVPFVAPYASFAMIKFIHIEHHRHTNEPRHIDPDQWTSDGPAWQLPLRWATLDVWYVVYYARRLRERPRRELAAAGAVVLAVAAVVTGLCLAGAGSEVLLWFAGQRVGVLVLAWWFDYLPHHGLTVTQREHKYGATRVRVGRESWMTPLFVYQNYHLVHHLHPSVPFYRYVRAWRRNEQAYLDRDAAVSTWFGRSLSPEEYRTWRRLTAAMADRPDDAAGTAGPRPEFHQLKVAAVTPLTADARQVEFEVPADLAATFAHRPGQHVTVRAIIDDVAVTRTYSLVTAPSEGRLVIAVRAVPDGTFSRYVLDRLGAGDVLDVMPPAGRFHTDLTPGARRRYVAVAAGSGITPMMSLLRATAEVEPDSSLTLVYGNRTRETTMFAADLAQLAAEHPRLTVHHVLSREAAAGCLEGRVDAALVRRLTEADATPVDAWFLCGPEAMVDDLATELGTTERVLTEVFHATATSGGPALDVESRVSVRVGGREASFDLRSTGDSVLDAALRAGLEPPYSCAGGACGTCVARVTRGRAVMDQNHALGDDEVAAGYVLTCQAHPVTEDVAVDYDA